VETLQTLLYVLQVLVAVTLIGFILIQHGKGADAGAAFGSGASATVFGASGSGNFMTRATTILAIVFLANSLSLAYIATQRTRKVTSLMEQAAKVTAPVVPASTPAPADQSPAVPAPAAPASDVPAIPMK